MADARTGFVLRVDSLARSSNRCPYYASPCGSAHKKLSRAADAKLFASEEDAEAFGCKISRPHLMSPVDSFTVLPAAIHTIKVSGDERELIRQALLAGNEEQQQLSAALFNEEDSADG